MQERLLKYALVFGIIFSVASLTVMLHFASVKTIVIAEEAAAENSVSGEGRGTEEPAEKNLLHFREEAEGSDYLCIPLPEEVRADDIVIENRYMDHMINIVISGKYGGFYEEQELAGNFRKITEGHFYEENDDVTRLQLGLSGLYEHEYVFENGMLWLRFVPPRMLYDKIIVIDAANGADHGTAQADVREKTITLDIVTRLKKRLEDSGIRAYYTRLDDEDPPVESRVRLANALHADMLVSIHVTSDEKNSKIYGIQTIYNKDYFIPGLGNIQLADLVEREVVTAVKGKANGLFEAGQENVLLNAAQVPAAEVEVGYLSNEAEAALLEQEEYREQIADGLMSAILKAYELKEAEG